MKAQQEMSLDTSAEAGMCEKKISDDYNEFVNYFRLIHLSIIQQSWPVYHQMLNLC